MTTRFYTQKCGCQFPINEKYLEKRKRPLEWYIDNNFIPPVDFDVENIPIDCPAVWNIMAEGLTKGIFQLESSLGKAWTKNLKPTCIEHISALGALLRPGCLHSIDKKYGCSLTELYCKRKNGELPVEYMHECLRPVLETTYGVLSYQEQAMELTRIIAGFNLQEADMLRKAIGKKLPEEMAKVEIMFYEGAAKCKVVPEEMYREIFGWIKESQRYSFNKAHSLSYGINGYRSAYCKAHFPVQFFTSFLRQAKEKPKPLEEIKELVNEAKIMGIEILTPDLRSLKSSFHMEENEKIRFGLADIKGIGHAQVEKIKQVILTAEMQYGKKVEDLSWYDFLVIVSPKISSTATEQLIKVGALSYMDK
jgi:DNA polymerase-3 subunit alpha